MIDELVEAVISISPEKTDFSREAEPEHAVMPGIAAFNPSFLAELKTKPSASAIADYGRRYAAWVGALRVHFGRLHRSLPRTRLLLDVRWVLGNVGTMPAEGMILDIKATGGIALADTRLLPKEPSFCLPEPPTPPAWEVPPTTLQEMARLHAGLKAGQPKFDLSLDFVGRNNHGHREPARDPYALHRRGGPVRPLSRKWSFECSEFRHGGDPQTFEATVMSVGLSDSGALRFRASARNMPAPVEALLPVGFVSCTGQTEEEARALVDIARSAETMRRRFRVPFRL